MMDQPYTVQHTMLAATGWRVVSWVEIVDGVTGVSSAEPKAYPLIGWAILKYDDEPYPVIEPMRLEDCGYVDVLDCPILDTGEHRLGILQPHDAFDPASWQDMATTELNRELERRKKKKRT